MKPVKSITFCAVIAALSSVIMLASYIPYITYASAALAGVLFIVPVIELSKPKAFLTFLVTAVFALLFAEPYSKVLFVCFFGYYPILKAVIEKIKNTALCVVFKLLCFNAAAVLSFFMLNFAVSIPFKEMEFSNIYILGAVLVANIVFLLYDYGINGVVQFYMMRLHPTVYGMLKGNRR